MNEQELFKEQLSILRELAEEQGGVISTEDIKEAFSDMELSEEQLQLILNYIREKTKMKIGTSGEEPDVTPADVNKSGRLSERDSAYLEKYLKEIENLPTLTDGQKRAFLMSAMNGDSVAKEQLVMGTIPQIVDFARIYAGNGVFVEDLIGEGNVALMMAMDVIEQEENPDEAQQMIATMIMSAMEELVREDSQSKDAFETWAERANEVLDKAKELSEDLMRKITVDELCREAEFDREFVLEVLDLTNGAIEYIETEKKD